MQMPSVDPGQSSLAVDPTLDSTNPLITIVTVVLNASDVLRSALKSIQNQEYKNIQYIIIDGGSTDGTVDLIKEYQHVIANWISEPDGGIYDAMNKGLALARGDWLLFIGADDELVVSLSTIVSKMRDKNSVYYGDVVLTETGKVYGGRFGRYRLMQMNICHQCIFYPREVYRNKNYDPKVGMQADYLYNLQLWGSGVPFKHVDAIICKFSIEGRSKGTSSDFEQIKLAAIRENFGHFYYVMKRARNLTTKTIKRLLRYG
jgi:glycosyltransferase involved in cell wall biosynthesis